MLFGSHFFSKWKTSNLFFDCVYLNLKMLLVKSRRWHRPLTIDCHTGSCYGISHLFGENLERQILALVSNVVLDSFQGCFTGLEKIPQESHERLNRSCDLEGQCKSPKREMRRPGNPSFRVPVEARGVCAVAPSCWNHMSSSTNSVNCSRKNS